MEIPEGYTLRRCVRGPIPKLSLDDKNLTARQKTQLKYRMKNRETTKEYQREYYIRRKDQKKIETKNQEKN